MLLISDYLVGDGFAVFDELVVIVVDVEFDVCVLLLPIVDEFEFIEFDGAVVVVDDELVTVVETAFEFMFVLDRLVLVLFAVSPPQAAPRAVKPKSAESAIAFFMSETISCLSQRLI